MNPENCERTGAGQNTRGDRHQREMLRNAEVWNEKPLLRRAYGEFFERIVNCFDRSAAGVIAEIGSGAGNLKRFYPGLIATDYYYSRWLDVVCDAYELPFADGSVSHLVMLDVFHHLARPALFLKQAHRVLEKGGSVILMEPYISWASWIVYGALHDEPVGWGRPIDLGTEDKPEGYYAAQGNATRLFFGRNRSDWLAGWQIERAERFACWSYFATGGFSKRQVARERWWPLLCKADQWLSVSPLLFAGRCLVVLRRQ